MHTGALVLGGCIKPIATTTLALSVFVCVWLRVQRQPPEKKAIFITVGSNLANNLYGNRGSVISFASWLQRAADIVK